jgi:hypothetical protein
MKNWILIVIVIMIFSCKTKVKESLPLEPQIHTEWNGNWVGNFIADVFDESKEFSYSNKINIKIMQIKGNSEVLAQSIVAGNKRMMKGTFNTIENSFTLKEPGTNKYDGVFEFKIKNDTLTGIWTAYDTSVTVKRRTYTLTKTQFVYNHMLMLPNIDEIGEYADYTSSKDSLLKDEDGTEYTVSYYRFASEIIFQLNASTQELKEDDLKNLKKLELEIIRNTIYARHGYTFNKRAYRQFFDPVDWYVPMFDNVEDKLTKLEVKNIALLKKFEQYAEDNYDTFGR